jgi:hypothetical protein
VRFVGCFLVVTRVAPGSVAVNFNQLRCAVRRQYLPREPTLTPMAGLRCTHMFVYICVWTCARVRVRARSYLCPTRTHDAADWDGRVRSFLDPAYPDEVFSEQDNLVRPFSCAWCGV